MTLSTLEHVSTSYPHAVNPAAEAITVLNGWDLSCVQDYIARESSCGADTAMAVSEYRRFIHMTLTAPHPCVPSQAVDEVWHAHMLHSRDYTAFCTAMDRDYIHHEPARPDEKASLAPYFAQTTAFYEQCFGEKPRAAIWGNSGQAICWDHQPGSDCRGTCSHNCQNQ